MQAQIRKQKKSEEKMLSDIYQVASDELDRVKKDTVMLDQIDKTDDSIEE